MSTTKLTLLLDADVIRKAKEYAKFNGRSLSEIVENYFKLLSSKEKNDQEIEITPLVNKMTGSIKAPEDFDFDKAMEEAKMGKHGKSLFR